MERVPDALSSRYHRVMRTPFPGPRPGRRSTALFAVVATAAMTLGVAPPVAAATASAAAAACVPTVDVDLSAARVWDEAALDAPLRDQLRLAMQAIAADK